MRTTCYRLHGIHWAWLAVLLLAAGASVQAAPWAVSTGFESPEYAIGSLAGQNGWLTSGTARIESSEVYAGSQAAQLTTGSLAWLDVGTTTETIVNVQAYYKMVPVAEYPALPAEPGTSCILCLHATDGLMCLNGDNLGSGTWVSASVSVTTWSLILLRQNYTAHTWSLTVNGTLALENLGNTYPTTSFQRLECDAGSGGPMYVDNLAMGPEAPPAMSVPANVQASDGTFTTKVAVTWDAVSGAGAYCVRRADSPAAPAVVIAPWQSATSFDDTTAVPGTTYYYYVQAAADAAGNNPSALSIPDTGYARVGRKPPSVWLLQ